MLDHQERRRLERIAVRLDRALGAGFAGAHRSRMRGRSLDFADWREYLPGDDVRAIDVQAWARLDQVVIRLYEADVDLAAHVIVDTSASMASGDKLGQATRIAGAIGVILLARNESLSLSTVADARPHRFRARTAIGRYLERLDTLSPAGPTPLADRARSLMARRPRRGLMIVISDFLTDEWEEAINRLTSRGEPLLAICVTAATDDAPDVAGEVQLVDVETQQRVNVDLSPDLVETFSARRSQRRERIKRRVQRRGGRFIEVPASASLFDDVTPALLKSGVFV